MNERPSLLATALHLHKKLVRNKRNVTVFVLLLLVSGGLVGGIAVFFNNGWIKFFQVTVFLLLGYMHVQILNGKLSVLSRAERFLYSFFLTAGIFVLLGVFYFIAKQYTMLPVFAGGCAFALPFTVTELWRTYAGLQAGPVKAWSYTEDLSLQRSTTFLDSIPVRFKVETNWYERNSKMLFFRAPVRMKLGLIFYHLVQEQNDNGHNSLVLTDSAGNPYQWVFFTTGITGTKYLDPETSLLDNRVRQNAVVIARRVNG